MHKVTLWLDHVTDPEDEFYVHKISDEIYRFTPAGEVLQLGTPQNQTNFRNLEFGVLESHIAVTLILNALRQLSWEKDEQQDAIGDLQAEDIELAGDIEELEEKTGLKVSDIKNALVMVMNMARQNHWDIDDIKAWIEKRDAIETGTKALTNSLKFPFNNSKQTVSLGTARKNTNYIVLTEVIAYSGNVGQVTVSGKLVNGFSISYTGSAKSVTVKYTVLGGNET